MSKIGLSVIFIIIFAFSTVLIEPSQGSEPGMLWSKTYYGDSGRAVQTSGGEYAIGASNASMVFYPATQRAPEIIKTDSSGNVQWNRTFNFVGLVAVSSIFQAEDGGYVLAGTNIGPPQTLQYTAWLIKTDSNGNFQWRQTFDSWQTCHAIITVDSSYVLAGYVQNNANGADGTLAKVDSNGNIKWTKTYAQGTSQLFITSLISPKDGGYVLAGSFNKDGWLSKADGNGNLQWTQTYHPNGYSTVPITAVSLANDGGYILAGGNLTTSFLLKADQQGKFSWFNNYSEPGLIFSVVQALNGNIFAVGNLNGQASLIQTDDLGNLIF